MIEYENTYNNFNDGIDDIEKNKNNAELEKGLKELQQHFENLHSLINQYIIKRNKDLYEKTITNLKAMEDFWAGLSMEQPTTH